MKLRLDRFGFSLWQHLTRHWCFCISVVPQRGHSYRLGTELRVRTKGDHRGIAFEISFIRYLFEIEIADSRHEDML